MLVILVIKESISGILCFSSVSMMLTFFAGMDKFFNFKYGFGIVLNAFLAFVEIGDTCMICVLINIKLF